ncbi:MAG: hypothetical protein KDC98_09335 [Planctomycetes bacterium]|nr:hypothetical protein [Planctomycetota bacterium]
MNANFTAVKNAAAQAQSTASGAQSTANGAQSTADGAVAAAATAQSTANGAQSTADQALSTANANTSAISGISSSLSGTLNPTDVKINTSISTHRLVVKATATTTQALRLIGPTGTYGYAARLNFGDSNYVYIEEPTDDSLKIYSAGGTTVDGSFTVTGSKNFVQPHPVDPSLQISFVCLEGNESGTYFRGSSRTANGIAVIEVPEEFRHVSSRDNLTVQVTAMGPASVWVESKSLQTVVVRSDRDVEFDYFVNGIRRGFEDFEPVAENVAFRPSVRGLPFGSNLPIGVRQILVMNGMLNADFTPNEIVTSSLGITLQDPTLDELSDFAPGGKAHK